MTSISDILDSITDAQKSVLCERYLSKRPGQLEIDGAWHLEHGVIVINETRKARDDGASWSVTHRIMEDGEVAIFGRRATVCDDLRKALQMIMMIENNTSGGDWDEIDLAREIAKNALQKDACNQVLDDTED